ncbi:MAG: PEGA domain-containing protein [Verrucomicrobia bacterium]|nr:PEGA domain-containing protein [Verrucomicrobiota bacterium]
MRPSHPYSVLHLHSEGATALTKKITPAGNLEPHSFYQSPKATGSLETALKRFFEDSKKDLLYINVVSEAPTLQSFNDTTLLKEPDAFAQVLEANSGIAAKDCDVQFLEAESGTPFSGNGPLLVNCFKRSDFLRAQAIASELGFEQFELFSNTLSILGALSEWRKEFRSQESVAILEVGENTSVVTISTADGQIASKKIPVSVQNLAESIQEKLQLKFESAALLLFYNGVFDFSQHKEAISANFAEKLTPHLQNLAGKFSVELDRLLISSFPPSYSWLNEDTAAAAGLRAFSKDEFYFLQDLSALGDCAENPGFLGTAFCAHSKPDANPWMVSLRIQSIADACQNCQGMAVSSIKTVEDVPVATEPELDEATAVQPSTPEFAEGNEPRNEELSQAEKSYEPEEEVSIEPIESKGLFEESDVEEFTLEENDQESPKEVVNYNQTKKEEPRPAKSQKDVTPINEEDKKNRLGLIWGGVAALLIIGGGSYFYLQNPKKAPIPVPIPIPQVAETAPDLEAETAIEERGLEVATTETEEPIGTPTRTTFQEPKQELESIDLFEVAEAEQAPPEPAPTIPTGSLLIDSEPSGATVSINGEIRGTTPITVEELELDEYAVEFKLDGYVTKLLDVAVESEEIQVVRTEMLLPYGTLEVHTAPEGIDFDVVSVEGLDRIIYSGITPATLPKILKGRYEIQFTRDNWEDHSEPVIIRFNDTSRVDLVYPEGWLMITSIPDNISVFEKGRFVGKTPLRLKGLKEGERTYTLRHRDYEDLELVTQIESQTEKRLDGTLLSWDREVDYNQLDIPPTPVKKSLSYTQRLVGKDAHQFLVEFVISKEGIPEQIEILETTYLRAHDRLIKDISKWTFEPGIRKDRAVKTRVRLPIILGDVSDLPPTVELARTDSENE